MSGLPDGWKDTTLGSVVKYVNIKTSIDTVDFNNYVSTENLIPNKMGVLKASTLPNISKVNAYAKGDTLFSNIRTYFKKVWYSDKNGGASNDVLIFRPIDEQVVEKNFLYYLISNDIFIDYTVSTAKGTKMPRGDKEAIKLYSLFLPPLPEQKSIAKLLSSFDEKIELLREQNETLETLAQTIFKEWFVDETDAILGVGKLCDFADNIKNSIKPQNINTKVKYVGLEHISRKSCALTEAGCSSNVKSNKYQFCEDDILFGKLRPYFHKVCFAPFNGVCSTDILVIRPKQKYLFSYCFFAFFQDDVINHVTQSSQGTRMPRTNWEMLGQYQVNIPHETTLKRFNKIVLPSIEKIKNNIAQIKTLTKTRDTLLPKLMSGEVRVN